MVNDRVSSGRSREKRVFRKTVKVRLRLKSFLRPQEEIQRNPSFNKKRELRVKIIRMMTRPHA